MMRWHRSHRADRRALPLADRHYNRQKPGSKQFVPPASCLVLLTEQADALWVTLAPIAKYVQHDWAGAWTCTLFRREPECEYLASDLIRDAVAATRFYYGIPPPQGFITFVDPRYTTPSSVGVTGAGIPVGGGTSTNPGYCYLKAGWEPVGHTKGGLVALHLDPSEVEPIAPLPFITEHAT